MAKLQGHSGPLTHTLIDVLRRWIFWSSLKPAWDSQTDGRARCVMRPTRQRHNKSRDRYDIIVSLNLA